jgi:hypothetical protein
LWTLFWTKDDIFNPILRQILSQTHNSHTDTHPVLRAALSLAAFEEEKLSLSQSYDERLKDSDIAHEDTWSI